MTCAPIWSRRWAHCLLDPFCPAGDPAAIRCALRAKTVDSTQRAVPDRNTCCQSRPAVCWPGLSPLAELLKSPELTESANWQLPITDTKSARRNLPRNARRKTSSSRRPNARVRVRVKRAMGPKTAFWAIRLRRRNRQRPDNAFQALSKSVPASWSIDLAERSGACSTMAFAKPGKLRRMDCKYVGS